MTTAPDNVDEETWRKLESKAREKGMTVSEFLEDVVGENEKGNWKEILYGEKPLSEEEAEKMQEFSKEFRKNFNMRYH